MKGKKKNQFFFTERKISFMGFIEDPYKEIWNGYQKYGSFCGFTQAPN